LPRVRGVDPAIAFALEQFRRDVPVRDVVEAIGWSHRRFIARFRETVGMAPKRFCRVRRLARVLRLASRRPDASLAELALDAGYSDQPHFNREFRELTDMAPGEYRSAAPVNAHHVPLSSRA
jgi:AraC-like DNA-binding protein